MLVDAFAHFLPPGLRDELKGACDLSKPGLLNWAGSKALCDVDHRIATLDEMGIDKQVITTPNPSLDSVFSSEEAAHIARIANDSMKKSVDRFPDRLIGIATLSLSAGDAAIEELRRAVFDLGLGGALIYTNVAGAPLDAPQFRDFFEAVAEFDVPLWLHPDRDPTVPEYPSEAASRYDLHLMYGLLFDTTIAMSRLVFSGIFDGGKEPRILVHHAGGMIPFFSQRGDLHYGDAATRKRLGRSVEDYTDKLKRFYADTMTSGSAGAVRVAYDFYGAERMMFASDTPFGPQEGKLFVRTCLESLERTGISSEDLALIRGENALRFVANSSTATR